MIMYHSIAVSAGDSDLRHLPGGLSQQVAVATFLVYERALSVGDKPRRVEAVTKEGDKVTVRLACACDHEEGAHS